MKNIPLTTPEVRSLLETGKAVIERDLEPQPHPITEAMRDIPGTDVWWAAVVVENEYGIEYHNPGSDYQHDWECPFGKVGDVLWVQEDWQRYSNGLSGVECVWKHISDVFYRDDESDQRTVPMSGQWRHALCMPRWSSRLNIQVTEVEVVESDGRWRWRAEVERVYQR